MLTLFYASATFLQSWRIKCACNKLTEQLASQASVAFYALPSATNDGFDPSVATSELCINRIIAKVTEVLWLQGRQRGCCLRPMQLLHISPWISFSAAPSLLPFAYNETPENISKHWSAAGDENRLRLLLETEVKPEREAALDFVRIEEYGKLIAWRIDSHLAVLIETDIEHFTKLLIATYLQNNLHINDHLRLLRIQSIKDEGKPQPLHLVASHLRKPTRNRVNLEVEEWEKHLEGLRSLCVLASQATEFEYKQNLTEGKSGVVKPDLIPSDKKKKQEEQIKNVTGSKINANVIEISKSTKGSDKNNTTPTTTIIDGTRFTTTKVDSPSKSISPNKTSSTGEMSELEKLAAVTAAQLRQQAATKNVITNKTTTSGASTSAAVLAAMKTSKGTDHKEANVNKPSTSTTQPDQKQIDSQNDLATKPPLETPKATNIAMPTTSNMQTTQPLVTEASISVVDASPKHIKSDTQNLNGNTTTKNTTAVSTVKDDAQRPPLQRSKGSLTQSKPLNILVYSDSASVRESVMNTLKDILEDNTYTIYQLTTQQVELKNWFESTALLIVCGSVTATPTCQILVDYFLMGGKVLSICSDILHSILPNYRTAEVREHELVQFSYDKWQKVKMMHHIFCYQPSPVKKNFSTDSEDSSQMKRQPALVCPRSIELKDMRGENHNLDVIVLGTEETWQTPSLLLAASPKSNGRALFSQVHLEASPIQFEDDEKKYAILKQNEKIRLEILSDLLSKYLDMRTKVPTGVTAKGIVYQNAYFLGHHESKFKLLDRLKSESGGNIIRTSKLTMQFCGLEDKPIKAESNVLPIIIHSCPDDFSTVQYFDNLKTKYIGRLVIYAPIISSSMDIVEPLKLTNGIAVLVRQQTNGIGRSGNQWLSPLGCAMSSVQLHVNINSTLGQHIPIMQHLIGAAMVNALKSHEDYRVLDVGLKWPNDVYVNGNTKIGGLLVKTIMYEDLIIVNLGFGLNLDNAKPTCCLNELIREYNRNQAKQIPLITYEKLLALIFNEIEKLIENVEYKGFDDFLDLYLHLWLHNDQSVKICGVDGKEQDAKIIGIDDNGFLRVLLNSGALETVQPDGNSFDMLKGLIVPKFN